MVPIDLHKLLEKTKKEIVKRFEEINVESYPVDFAWLLYALQHERDSPLFTENFEKLKIWSFSNDSERNDRNIGALALCMYFMGESNEATKILERIKAILERNLNKLQFRHNVLNDPGEMFLISLISDCLEENLRNQLLEISAKNIIGSISRKILFLASSIDFGMEPNKVENTAKKILVESELKKIEDVIAVLWFCKKFDKLSEYIPSLLVKLDKMFFILEEDNRISIPTQYLALLYEIISKELAGPHPLTIFSLYPFERELRRICEEHIKNKKYSTAISEALKKVKEILKEKAKESGMDPNKIKNLETKERIFIRELLNPRIPQNYRERDIEEIPIRFSELKDKGELNFQEGLALLLEGAWAAFRHPEAHYPENHQIRRLDPYEAIAILVLIDYLLKQIKKVKT